MAGFTPVQMEVQKASKARGDIPARVCLLSREGTLCKIYALPRDWKTNMAELSLEEAKEAPTDGTS